MFLLKILAVAGGVLAIKTLINHVGNKKKYGTFVDGYEISDAPEQQDDKGDGAV